MDKVNIFYDIESERLYIISIDQDWSTPQMRKVLEYLHIKFEGNNVYVDENLEGTKLRRRCYGSEDDGTICIFISPTSFVDYICDALMNIINSEVCNGD